MNCQRRPLNNWAEPNSAHHEPERRRSLVPQLEPTEAKGLSGTVSQTVVGRVGVGFGVGVLGVQKRRAPRAVHVGPAWFLRGSSLVELASLLGGG